MSDSGQPLVKIIDLNLIQAFDQWAVQRGMRGRDSADTIAKVMRYWVSFAMAKVPRGDAAKIRQDLRRIITTYSNLRAIAGPKTNLRTRKTTRDARADQLRGSMAAAIVAILNYRGARDLAKARSPQFYAKVNQFINARAHSANHHRSGFLPAINVLGRGTGKGTANSAAVAGRLPKYQHPPGAVAHKFTDQLASILVENFASAAGPHAAGITGLAGGAFDAGLTEVIAMIGNFLRDDLLKSAQAAGFAVTPRPAAA
jgi:hypothetical protein